MKRYYVYIMASARNGTLYIGITSDLARRAYEHKEGLIKGFTRKYRVHTLVYYEEHGDVHEAIAREKLVKKWRRDWKLRMIERLNPEWKDLYDDLVS